MIRLYCVLIAGTSIAVTAGTVNVFDSSVLDAIADGDLTVSTPLELVSATVLVLTICVVLFVTQRDSDKWPAYGEEAQARLDAARDAAFEYAPWVPTVWLSPRRGGTPTYSPFRNEIRWPAWLITALSRDQVCRATIAYCGLARARRMLCIWQLGLFCGLAGILIGALFVWLAAPIAQSGAFLAGGFAMVLASVFFKRRLQRRVLERSVHQPEADTPPQPQADVRDLAEHIQRDRIADSEKEVA